MQTTKIKDIGKDEKDDRPGEKPLPAPLPATPEDERIPVPPGEIPPEPIYAPGDPGNKAPIDEGPKGPKEYV